MSSIVYGVGRVASSGWAFLQRATASVFHSPLLVNLNKVESSASPLTRNYHGHQSVSHDPLRADTSASKHYAVLQDVRKKTAPKNEDFYLSHYVKNVTEIPSFEKGLACDALKRASFHASAKKDDMAAFSYIANNTNPNYLLGIFSNIFRFFSTGALNQNCVFCSKAVDKNLAALAQGRIETFWVAHSTGRYSATERTGR